MMTEAEAATGAVNQTESGQLLQIFKNNRGRDAPASIFVPLKLQVNCLNFLFQNYCGI